jgi:hypothetical protein
MRAVWLAVSLASLGVTTQGLIQEVEAPLTPIEHRRGPEQTFLTVPEWFLVHSPAELAAYLQDQRPSMFPYFGHIRQFWESYAAVYRVTKDDYPLNVGYHVMVMVIGVSTTVEYAVKAAYETVIGRVTELTRTHGMTEEDRFAARVAQDYVDFINVTPWYEYDFAGTALALWKETSLWGPDMIRKWERKYILTTEYGVKAIYGWIIERLTTMGYEPPIPLTAVLVDRLPPGAADELPDLTVLRVLPDSSVLVTVPRYDAFKHHALGLARHGARFVEIAGNRSPVLVSYLVPAGWSEDESRHTIMLRQPILTRPATQRIVISVPVDGLQAVLVEFDEPRFDLEHVYDF